MNIMIAPTYFHLSFNFKGLLFGKIQLKFLQIERLKLSIK